MRKFLFAALATVAVGAAVPAYADTPLVNSSIDLSAQSVVIDTPGVDVRIGQSRRHHNRWESRRETRRVRRSRCRTVTIRDRRPNGTVVIRKQTRC